MGKKSIFTIALLAIVCVFSLPSNLAAQTIGSDHRHVATLATYDISGIDNYEIVFPQGWSFFAFPAKPIAENPEDLFYDTFGNKIPIDGNLYSFNPHSQENFTYDAAKPEEFGPIDQNLGYWLRVDEATTLKYLGTKTYNKKSTWLHRGMNMLAYPFETAQRVEALMVREHATGRMMSFAQARSEGIVDAVIYGWTNDWTQGLFDIGLEEDFASSYEMQPKHGYWIQAFRDGFEIVISQPSAT